MSVIPGDYVFSDPIAFRHLAQEVGTQVVEENYVIQEYQVYIVEQWVCSRVHPAFVVTTFTGEKSHEVTVSVLRILEGVQYSDRLKHYFETLAEFHARPKDTPKGKIFVTNLSSFPSALNVVHVRDGKVDAHREDFTVNENLKRMGCTGRSALTLDPPTNATQDKFHQLYRTSDKIKFSETVVDLVKLVQSCLYIFGELSPDMIDGLLCDVTERSLVEWWKKYGTPFYDVERTDGILGPTTVAGILGMTLGVRYRLLSVRIEAPKDMTEVEHFKEAIAHFQEKMKLERTKILDRVTLDKLYMLTARSATGEHRLPGTKTLRTTVNDLSNRTVVNAADIETCDIDDFIQHLHGGRLKYMWQGKGRRPSGSSINAPSPTQSFQDLKEAGKHSKRHKVLQGVKSGAKGVGKIVRRGPETVLERVQNQRAAARRERERDNSEDVDLSAMELGEPLTLARTRDTDSGSQLTCPVSRIVPRIHTEEGSLETPRSSLSVPRSSPPLSIDSRPMSAYSEREHHDAWYPRRLSFSVAQDAIETWRCPFGVQTDHIEEEIEIINKWTEDQLDLLEKSTSQIETNLPSISASYSTKLEALNSLEAALKELSQQIVAFKDKTRGIYNTTMKLQYAYSSSDGLLEKMHNVESVTESIQARMEKLNVRLEAVEKIRQQYKLERKYRNRWLKFGGICVAVGLVWIYFRSS